jgi:hypothetical protein
MDARETSLRNATFVFKYCFGVGFCAFGASIFNREHAYATGLVSLEFFVIGTFFLSVAQVQAGRVELKYRRWLHWRSVPYSEVLDCGEAWVFGYVRLRRHAFPWQRIHFVRPYASSSLFGWDKAIISSIRSKAQL